MREAYRTVGVEGEEEVEGEGVGWDGGTEEGG